MDAAHDDYDELSLSPAMRTALFQKPHDRQFIIDLENSILSFIESNAESYQLRPMNSYYRLLSHQVAEFHDLKHALARAHDNCVIIFKGNQFKKTKNRRLLRELEPVPAGPDEYLESAQSNEHLSSKSEIRYKILKRQDGPKSGSVPFHEEDGDPNTEYRTDSDEYEANLELQKIEKEREYEQKKQEIFNTPTKKVFFPKDGDGTSPQPSEFETSRYHLHHIDSSPPPPPPPYRHNNRARKRNNGGGYKDKRGAHFNDRSLNYNYTDTSPGPYNAGYMMYPTPPMAPGPLNSSQFPMMYPSPFPMDGSNGFIPPFMCQPMNGGSCDPEGSLPPGFVPYPFPYQFATPNYHHQSRNAPRRPHGQPSPQNSRSRSSSDFSNSKDRHTRQHSSSPQHKTQIEVVEQGSVSSVSNQEEDIDTDIDNTVEGLNNLSV